MMSLFISVITMGMFDAYDEMKELEHHRAYEKALQAHQISLDERSEETGSKLRDVIAQAMAHDPATFRLNENDHSARAAVWRAYETLSLRCKALAHNQVFTGLITLAIVVVGICTGLSTDETASAVVLSAINQAVIILFMIEAAVKIVAEKWRPINCASAPLPPAHCPLPTVRPLPTRPCSPSKESRLTCLTSRGSRL